MPKPKIMMVGDTPYWAYYYLTKFIRQELGYKYDFYTDFCIFYHRLNHAKDGALGKSYLKKLKRYSYYFKYHSERRMLPHRQRYDVICYLGWFFPYVYDFKLRGERVIQGIFTDGFPPQGPGLEIDLRIGIPEFVNKYLDRAAAVACGSKSIQERFQKYVNSYYCTGAIDAQMFRPGLHRSHKDSFVVGWTGKPDRNFKGFYDFVVPAVQKASTLRKGIVLKSRFKGPYRTLPGFYQDVDVLLIASSADAGPSSFLEAGACGVPSISTRVGYPAETISDGENGLFVNRSVDDFVAALIYVYDHREHLQRMSGQIRLDIENNWNYKLRSKLWDQLFEASLAR